ncbi:MAG: polynucleotide adenylyltransferase PcnB [Candidatus Alcyoniella australis]|nr:polynucleotide adenylyltransferase PcnB [Candidatus Alcyoniella australis]
MRIIPRSEHPISRKNIDPDALKVLYRLHRYGFKAYLVGGSVRDMLLSKRPKDFDMSTDAHPYEVKKLFRNCRIVGRRFRLAHVFFAQNKIIEVSTFRRKAEFDAAQVGGVQTENTFGTPEEDAFRRDLTINGLFYNIADHTVIDYVNGLRDLRDGVVRMINDPYASIVEDPVRMIRAIRHAARSNFVIHAKTWEAIKAEHALINNCPESRLREEFLRDLRGGAAAVAIRLMSRSGLLFELIPEMRSLVGDEPEPEMPESALANLRVTDRMMREGRDVSDSILVAALLAPLVLQTLGRARLPENPSRAGRVNVLIRDLVKPLSQKLNMPKRVTEQACQILFAQHQIHSAIDSGGIPSRLRAKQYFNAGMQFFEIEKRAQGADEPYSAAGEPAHPPTSQPRYAAISTQSSGPDGSSPQRSRRRRRRPRRRNPATPQDS